MNSTDALRKQWTCAEKWVAQELRRRIAAGIYPPNSYLPAERLLAQELGVGRRQLRLAMTRIEQEELIDRCRGRGTRVLPAAERLQSTVIGVVQMHASSAGLPERNYLLQGIIERLTQEQISYEFVRPVYGASKAMVESPSLLPVDQIERRCSSYSGLVFVGSPYRLVDTLTEIEKRRMPLVIADLELDLPVTATWVDRAEITNRAVKTLLSFGHRRIAYVGREPTYYHYGKSLDGYRTGLKNAGLPVDQSLEVFCAATNCLAAYLAAKALFESAEPPTAVVAARDIFAHGICQAIEESGAVVGRDVSVIGFDDISWEQEDPCLTTFRLPCHELGRVAVDMLLDRLRNGWRPPEKRELESPLILRRSVGPKASLALPTQY